MSNENTLQRRRGPAHETRAQEVVHPEVHGDEWDAPWTPPSNLEAPPPRPGMRQRWVRVSMHGADDVSNYAKQQREGWRPRRADSVPKGFQVPSIKEGDFAGCIGVHGVILCEMPEERVRQRTAYYREQIEMQTQAVEHDLEKDFKSIGLDKTMRSRVAVGRRPKVAEAVDDD